MAPTADDPEPTGPSEAAPHGDEADATGEKPALKADALASEALAPEALASEALAPDARGPDPSRDAASAAHALAHAPTATPFGDEPRRRLDAAAAALALDAPGWAPTPGSDPWIGRVLDDRYRLERRLGAGGMGAVFRAHHLKLHKAVAVKVIRPELAGREEVALRFAREAMASAQVDHPHIAGATDFGVLEEGGAYLVMPLVEGPNLRVWLAERGPAPVEVVCAIGAQIADALAAAHRRGIVHRDLKPENLLLEARGDDPRPHVRVVDFGIARLRLGHDAPPGGRPDETITRAGTVVGTPGYMAPEQAMGEAVDQRADLYSLGVILWELATGEDPFRRRGRDVASVIRAQLVGVVVAPEASGLPEPLDALLRRLLDPDRARRPSDAVAVRDALERMGAAPSGTHPVLGVDALGREPAGPTRSDPPTVRTFVESLPAPPRLGAGGTAGLGVLALGGAVAMGALLAWSFAPRAPVPPVALTVPPLVVAGPSGGGDAPSGGAVAREPVPTTSAEGLTADEAAALTPLARERVLALLASDRWVDREAGATWIVGPEAEGAGIPAWVHAVASFELSRGCRDRKAAIEGVLAAGDPRGVPALERIARAPEVGCGPKKMRDCHGCIRGDLERAIRALDPARAASLFGQ